MYPYHFDVLFQIEGKTAEQIVDCRKSATTLRVQWSFASPEGISFQFDGILFLCVGSINYQCHQGDDVDLKTKMKRQEKQDKGGRKNKTVITICFV